MSKTQPKKYEIRLSGSGGQGLILAGIILARAAVLDNKKVTQTQSYGPESRGGASRADVIISDTEIYYPEAVNFDVFVALTQEACDKYIFDMKEGGLFIGDSSQIKNLSVIVVNEHMHPFEEIAIEKLGSLLPTNILSLGYLVKVSNVVSEKSLTQAIKDSVKPAFIDLNIKAMKLGFQLADDFMKGQDND